MGDGASHGAFRNAHLVTSYFRVESYALPADWRKRWARPSKSRRLHRLRAKLRAVRERMGLVEQPAYFDREPLAVLGPWPLPERRPERPAPAAVTVRVGPEWQPDGEVLTRPGFTWYFRSGLAARQPESPSRWPYVLA